MVTPKSRTAKDVDALLTVLRSHGVHQYRDGEFAVVLLPVHEAAPATAGEAEKPKLTDDPLFDAVR